MSNAGDVNAATQPNPAESGDILVPGAFLIMDDAIDKMPLLKTILHQPKLWYQTSTL